ncbi:MULTISPECIES: co-chaperone YbbN [Acidithiobacillus]|jgi:thioredoxin 1|uniref:Thioredoxin family protein n=1 Tax=Acidithiobacillus concretivorus TaxID=3063952 RepID=A0ABS5ZT93_9PROT|nr:MULTISPECIES: thioredoxin family protein [Acidithiobacillus]MBU2739911.1 thioredoxin family protein [Acidithiobacillus concretivorus]MDD2748606.1 thioredoxin family protein [Acidithiobacillus sp.]MDD5278839.1 thioredoxin family protein [Acidithiobacillus sp.]
MKTVSELGFWQRMAETRGEVVLFFSSAGCHSCRIWRRLLQNLEDNRSGLQVWEIDAGIDMGITREFEVYHLPALFLFHNGQYQRPIQVEARVHALEQWLNAHADLPPEELP